MIDLDDFKIVNDNYGHQRGDEVLVEFANLLKGSDYDDKVIGRYGGDEFIIAGVYRNDLNSPQRFELFNERLKEVNDKLGMELSFSAGTALYSKGDSASDMIYKADIKMYESKRMGKNRVSVWKGE